jgi:hypothetical protein
LPEAGQVNGGLRSLFARPALRCQARIVSGATIVAT